jgi:hypothetical protein
MTNADDFPGHADRGNGVYKWVAVEQGLPSRLPFPSSNIEVSVKISQYNYKMSKVIASQSSVLLRVLKRMPSADRHSH